MPLFSDDASTRLSAAVAGYLRICRDCADRPQSWPCTSHAPAALETSVVAAPQTRQHALMRPAMIQITKGNPTPEEIAAVVAVLALAGAATQPRPTCSTAAGSRRSAPLARLDPAALRTRE